MPLIGPELILLLIIIILLFRPKIIKDIASSIGRVVAGFSGESRRDKTTLNEVAERLGIDIRGKSEEEVLEEIKRKLSR